MAFAGVSALLVALLQATTVDADVSVRTEARPTAVRLNAAPGTTYRAAAATTPSATAIIDDTGLHVTAGYAPRIRTHDVEAHPTPYVDHVVEARLTTPGESQLRWSASAVAIRGHNDPLEDAVRAAAARQSVQTVTTLPARYESLRAVLGTERTFESGTTIGAIAEWYGARGIGRDITWIPQLSALALTLTTSIPFDERNTGRLAVRGSQTVTGEGATRAETNGLETVASWRRRFTERTEGWAGAGAEVVRSNGAANRALVGPRTEVRPTAELGVARFGDEASGSPRMSLTARVHSFVDRLTGQSAQAVYGGANLGWPVAHRLELTVNVTGMSRTDHVTQSIMGDVRAIWGVSEQVALELGVAALRQRETAPQLPSFTEIMAVVAVTWSRQHLFRTAPEAEVPATAPGW